MENNNEVKTTSRDKQGGKKYTIDWSSKAAKNVRKNQSAYMKMHGKSITLGEIACRLVETGSIMNHQVEV